MTFTFQQAPGRILRVGRKLRRTDVQETGLCVMFGTSNTHNQSRQQQEAGRMGGSL